MRTTVRPTGVTIELPGETLLLDAWGTDTIRVQSSPTGAFAPFTGALARQQGSAAEVTVPGDGASGVRVSSGRAVAVVEPSGRLEIRRRDRDGTVLGEPWFDPREAPARPHRQLLDRPGDPGGFEVRATFAAWPGERIHGLGQHTTSRLGLGGDVVDLYQVNSQVVVPAIVSSRGYGMLWNTPALGRVEFAANHTRWVAERAAQLDYLVYVGDTPEEIVGRYADVTGRPRPLPEWTGGFWQSKSYYSSQEELLGVAREHLARGLPLTAIFVDYMHWTHMGAWDWDRDRWPDPEGMVRELAGHGVRVLVSVWPHVSPYSPYFAQLRDRGLLVRRADGSLATFAYADRAHPGGLELALLDLTHPQARRFLWERVADSYHRIGISAFWLDACEPEVTGDGRNPREAGLRYHAGPGESVSSAFPLFMARAMREGLDAAGDTDAVLLARSAWAGSQRYGVVVWSGDVPSTWESLRTQVTAGLNAAVSGLPWWTSDVGGFFGGDPASEDFRELLVRWFQFAAFWPVLRLHGTRTPHFYESGFFPVGEPNEVWSFGERTYAALRPLLFLRERLRPYLAEQVTTAAATGVPPVRPLWFAFPDDEAAADVADQFLLGPDLLVAPVLEAGARSRRVHLPRGARWRNVWTGEVHPGGSAAVVRAPLDGVPVFERLGSALGVDGSWLEPLP